MRSRFRLNGMDHAVWLSRSDDGYHLHADTIEGEVNVSLRDLPDAAASRGGESASGNRSGSVGLVLTVGGVRSPVRVAQSGEDVFVHLGGRTYTLTYLDPVRGLAGEVAGSDENEVRAPMPGIVVAVRVKPGDEVAAGDALVVVESMKLETTLRAGHTGTVAAVHVTEDQTFERDHVLVTLTKSA